MAAINIEDDILEKLENIALENGTNVEEIINHQLKRSLEPIPELMGIEAFEQLELVTEAAHLGIWVLDIASGHLEWNEELLDIYGITRYQFENELDSWRNSVHPDDKDYAESRLGEAFTGKKIFDVLFRIIRPSGEIRYISAAATPVFDVEAKIIKVIGNNLDITEIRNTQNIISNQSTILEAILEAVIIVKPDYTILEWNPQAEKMYGWKSEEVIGHSLAEILPTQYINSTAEEVLRIFNAENIWKGDVIQSHKSGREIHVFVSISKIYDAQGQLIGYMGVNRDITAQKQAEQSALEERDLLRNIIDNVPDYIFVKDRNGVFVETNKAHALSGGITREEMIGHTAKDFFDSELAIQFTGDDGLVISQGKTLINEERITTDKNGNKRRVLTTKIPTYSRDGQITGLIGISRDITELREVQARRIEAERIKFEIEQERKTIELKQRFITTASHDFRTPLTIIRTSTTLLENYWERLSSDKRIEKLHKIQKQVDRMMFLLSAVLNVSQLESGKIQPQITPIALEEFCKRIWGDMLDIDEGKHATAFRFDAKIDYLHADENMLEQILVNLLSNAFKYTEEDHSIEFEVNRDDEQISFIIIDGGMGIPEEDRKHLFEPFHRATNVNDVEGTGLGLTIVKEYVLLHGGTIDVDSEIGKGTSITVRLPINNMN